MEKMLRFSPKIMVGTFCRAGTLRCYLRQLRYKLQGLDCPLFFHTEESVQNIGKKLGAKKTTVRTMGQLHFTVMEF